MESSSQQDLFVEQFVRSQGRVYAYIVTLLPNRDDAEEVFQQTSLALWKKWQEFDPKRDFVRWACGMAHLEVCSFMRKHSGRPRVDLCEDVLLEVAQVRLDMHDSLGLLVALLLPAVHPAGDDGSAASSETDPAPDKAGAPILD